MSQKSRRRILVLYFYRGPVPPRASIDAHLLCWKRFSENDVVMVNLALGFPESLVRRGDFDVVIFHTLFFSMRWGLPTWERAMRAIVSLRASKAWKIAMPQDEFYRTDLVDDFICDFGVDELWTCAKPSDFAKIYPQAHARGIAMKQVLTGYVDPTQRDRIEKIVAAADSRRPIDVGYRAWKAEPWLGRHGMLKLWIGQKALALGSALGFKTDISLEEKDVITGDDWFRYLASCKTVVGCEGGSGICDRDGTLRKALQSYREARPQAEFEEIHEALLRDRDGEIELWALSPRHFEACMTGTVQILVEGDYNGALMAGRHYIPVKRDLSDLEEALLTIRNESRLREIASRAREEVVRSDRWTYRTFVAEFDARLRARAAARRGSTMALFLLGIRDRLTWFLVGLEHRVDQSPSWAPVRGPLNALKGILKAAVLRRS